MLKEKNKARFDRLYRDKENLTTKEWAELVCLSIVGKGNLQRNVKQGVYSEVKKK